MTYQPHRRRFLAAFALFAGAPTLLRAQDKPPCEQRIELAGGALAVVQFMANTTAPIAKVRIKVTPDKINAVGFAQALKPMGLSNDPNDWGEVELTLARTDDGKGLTVAKVHFKTPYSGYATRGFAESAIAINTKPFSVSAPNDDMMWGRVEATLTTSSYGAAHEKEMVAQLLAGTRVRLWLKENPLYGQTTEPAYYAVELTSPNLKPKAAAILKAMKKVEKDAHDQKCATVSEGCFLTTAAVNTVGLADDCWELSTLRAFRDGQLGTAPGGAGLIADYYARAPGIVRAIDARPDAAMVWLRTYWGGVLPCAFAARLGMQRLAMSMYRRMTLRLEALAAA